MVLHDNLDTSLSPCTDSPGYNYARCINEKIVSTVGCQTFWSDLPGYPVCSNLKDFYRFSAEYDRFASMEKNELLTWSGCLRPCEYMEYQLADTPIHIHYHNQTKLNIIFSTSTIVLEREEFAFPFGSFVADFGGILGLFIGFNFLSVLEFLTVSLRELYFKCKNHATFDYE